MSRTSISDDEPDAQCGYCAKFKPDSENPKGGLGDCEIEKQDVLMRSWENHKGRLDWHWHYQKKLTYPGSEACGEYKRRERPSDSNDTTTQQGAPESTRGP